MFAPSVRQPDRLVGGTPRTVDTHAVQQVLCGPLIGREAEVEVIRSALDRAAAREGGMLFLIGDAGAGKSRLAREAIAQARARGFTALVGRAVHTGSPVAYRCLAEALLAHFRATGAPDLAEVEPFRPILGRLVPEWRGARADRLDDSNVLLAEALVRLVRSLAGSAGCLLVLEDLHWADQETLAIVEYLSDNLRTEPVVCIGTVRSGEGSLALDLAGALAARRAAAVVPVSRLGDEDVVVMTRACLEHLDVPDEVDGLLRAADGLPFLIEELLAAAVGSGALRRRGERWEVEHPLEPAVPRTFAETVRQRLAALGEPAARVLRAAAIFGRRFEWPLLGEVAGLGEDDVLATLHRAVDAQLLVAEPAGPAAFRFRHALTREAVLGELLPAERASLSARALLAIDAAHPALEGEWSDLAAQLAEQAGDRPRAAALLRESGTRALARGALATAEVALDRARDAAAGDAALRADVDEALLETLALAGKTDRAIEIGESLAVALEELAAPAVRRANAHLRLARAAIVAGRWAVAEANLARAGSFADGTMRPALDALAAHLEIGRGRPGEATRLAAAAIEAAERTGPPELVCEALEVIGRAARLHDLGQAEAAFERALQVASRNSLEVWRLRAAFELGTVDLIGGGPIDRLDRTRELASAAGALATVAQVDLHRAIWFMDRFDGERTVEAARRSAETARRFRMSALLAMALAVEAAGYARAGRRDEMTAAAEESLALGDFPDSGGTVWGHARATCALIDEDRAAALAALETSMTFLRRLSTTAPVPTRGLWALMRTIEGPDGDRAREEIRASGVTVHFMIRGFVGLGDAVALGRAGRRADAEAAFAEGDADLAPTEWYRHLARRLIAEAAIADGWGEPPAWLREAMPFFEERGDDRIAAACRSLLRKAGAPVPRKRRGEAPVPAALRALGITQRETEVLSLLAEGLANKEIGARLYLSPRTVERHVANLTVKAGVKTRSELVAFAARLP